MTLSIQDVYAFIDWDTASRCSWLSPIERAHAVSRGMEGQLNALYELLEDWTRRNTNGRIRVSVRFYHGWHKGNQPTEDRLALVSAKISKRAFGNIMIDPPEPADRLLCGADVRDTLRERRPGVLEQKMVDTALIADLLWLARSKSAMKDGVSFLVVSEDDDMLPGLAVATNWGPRCTIARNRDTRRSLPGTRLSIHCI